MKKGLIQIKDTAHNLQLKYLFPCTTCILLQGQATDIQIQAEEILRQKQRLNNLYAKHTNNPVDLIGKPDFLSF